MKVNGKMIRFKGKELFTGVMELNILEILSII